MADVVLITMPWDVLASPSLALGTLHRLLETHGIDVSTLSAKLMWMDHVLRHRRPDGPAIGIADYQPIACGASGLGDWVFAEPPMASADGIRRYGERLAERESEEQLARLHELRRLAPGFLDACAAEVLARRPRVVGFTTTFCQTMASLALARRLKEAQPAIRVVFGGANCDGPMGAALQRCFPWIDVVVRGEGEAVAPELFRALLSGAAPPPLAGLCYFADGAQVVVPTAAGQAVPMDAVPAPDYDDYFADLAACGFHQTLRPSVFLSFESARGCWWGEIAHCTFCGLNGSNIAFRSKPPERVLDELLGLARTYQVLDLHAVDNILDHGYLAELLPRLARSGYDLRLFYEVKSNLKKRQLQLLRRAGVDRLQPGIESLSTPILKLMRKGVTAWQNLRFLKWCAALEIVPDWNILYGFPGEPESEYARMAALIPSLTHLAPPRLGPLGVHRYSPYHQRPEAYGLEITGAASHYGMLYDLDAASLSEIAYDFEYRHRDGRNPEDYVGSCFEAVRAWEVAHGRGASLRYRRGPGYVTVRDDRDPAAAHRHELVLEGREADVYLACDDGARLATIRERTRLSPSEVEAVLELLAEARLVYREGDHVLGLAVPMRRGDGAMEAEAELGDQTPGAELLSIGGRIAGPASRRTALFAGAK